MNEARLVPKLGTELSCVLLFVDGRLCIETWRAQTSGVGGLSAFINAQH